MKGKMKKMWKIVGKAAVFVKNQVVWRNLGWRKDRRLCQK